VSTLSSDPSSPSTFSIQSDSSFADTVEHLEDELANLIAIAETLIQPTIMSTETSADVLAPAQAHHG
jgi:hypothetical protein